MSNLHTHEFPGQEIEGIKLDRPGIVRRDSAPQTAQALEMMLRLQRKEEETENLRYLAFTDQLTGLPNDRAFAAAFEETASTASTAHEAVGLLVADINGLKYANDKYDHIKGNQLLVAIGNVLRNNSRPGDQPFRLGGDEFAVIMPDYGVPKTSGVNNLEEEQHRLDAVTTVRYKEAAKIAIKKLGLSPKFVGLSVGVSVQQLGESPREFFRRVDKIMYDDKPRRDDPRLRPIA